MTTVATKTRHENLYNLTRDETNSTKPRHPEVTITAIL